LRIVHAETDDPAIPWMTFRAMPAGGPPTEFHWVHSAEPGLTFLNAAHDYPQRIRYWRDGRFLMAEIAAADGTKARRWRYSPRSR
jgi:predicted NAD/FAD-dependent oxidoreductase